MEGEEQTASDLSGEGEWVRDGQAFPGVKAAGRERTGQWYLEIKITPTEALTDFNMC